MPGVPEGPGPAWPLDGPINGESFRLYVEKVLVPTLGPGDIVILDNLGLHRSEAHPPPASPRRSPMASAAATDMARGKAQEVARLVRLNVWRSLKGQD
jgi:hypothetical protein